MRWDKLSVKLVFFVGFIRNNSGIKFDIGAFEIRHLSFFCAFTQVILTLWKHFKTLNA